MYNNRHYLYICTDLLKMHAAFWGGEEVADPRVCSSSRSEEHRAHIDCCAAYSLCTN